MNRQKLVVAAIVTSVVMLIAIFVVFTISRNNEEPDAANQDTAQQDDGHQDDHDHDEHFHDHGIDLSSADGEVTRTYNIYGETKVLPSYINENIIPKAHNAAREFVRQSTNEEFKDRRNRLSRFFTERSPALTISKPQVDPTNSKNTSTDAKVVSSQWEVKSDQVVATVFIEATTRSADESRREISKVTQGYDVTMLKHGNDYRAGSITPSNKSLIIRR